MSNIDINEQVKEIKRSFRLMMNGVTASSMREKGVNYSLNWGASLSMLKEKASEIGRNGELANALWKENVRECKILATMIMPPEEMTPEAVDEWMQQVSTQEIAELSSFNLLQHVACASSKSLLWIESEAEFYRLCGYNVLSRLFKKGTCFSDEEANRYFKSLTVALTGDSFMVKKAAILSAQHFADFSDDKETQIKKALEQLNLELF